MDHRIVVGHVDIAVVVVDDVVDIADDVVDCNHEDDLGKVDWRLEEEEVAIVCHVHENRLVQNVLQEIRNDENVPILDFV